MSLSYGIRSEQMQSGYDHLKGKYKDKVIGGINSGELLCIMRYNREKKELTFDEAKDKALRLLEFRSHSERELSDKLKRAVQRKKI